MQKQVQLTGERKWWGSDWLIIQNEVWTVLEGWLSQYGQAYILSGCAVTPGSGGHFNIAAGILFIKDGSGNYQYAQFAGATNVTLPGYLIINTVTTNILYEDGNSKAKLITNTINFTNSVPGGGVDFVYVTSTFAITWKEVVGLAMTVSLPGALATGHAIKFDKDRNEMFASVTGTLIHITCDFTNAVAGSVTRMRFSLGGGQGVTVDTAAGLTLIHTNGDLTMAPGSMNEMFFLYNGINESGDREVSYSINQIS
jgi:hypothetical protein